MKLYKLTITRIKKQKSLNELNQTDKPISSSYICSLRLRKQTEKTCSYVAYKSYKKNWELHSFYTILFESQTD